VEVRRSFPGHVVFRSMLDPENHDFQTIEYRATVAAGQRADLLYEIVRHQGYNKKQENVTTQQAGIEG
jgi:hypothetical protein